MSKKKIIIAIVLILLVLGVAVTIYYANSQKNTDSNTAIPPLRTKDELFKVVLDASPEFKDDAGNPIVKMSKDPQRLNNNWYIIRIVPTTYENDEAKILLYDEGGAAQSIKLVLGPGTAFPDEVYSTIIPTVPEIVRSEMNT